MTKTKDLIIIAASCGKNLELSGKVLEKSNELKISSEILDLTTLDIPLFNPRIHSKEKTQKIRYWNDYKQNGSKATSSWKSNWFTLCPDSL